mgnify:CR=1 FL=1
MRSVSLNFSWNYSSVVKQIIRYAFIGGLGTLFYIGVLMILVEFFNFQPIFASIIGFFCLVLVVYLPNYLWVFESNRAHHSSFSRFVIVAGVGLLANAGVMYAVVNIIGLSYMWGVLGATAVVPPVNFLLNMYWTFK